MNNMPSVEDKIKLEKIRRFLASADSLRKSIEEIQKNLIKIDSTKDNS